MSVTIEPFSPRHAPAVQRLASDVRIAATTLIPHPYPPGGAERFIEEAQRARARGEGYAFAVLAGGELVGACGLKEVHDRQADLGYWIGVPYWGRGYATEAARLVVAFAFGALGLERVTAHALLSNPASCRVLERVGFREVERAESPFERWPGETVVRYVFERSRAAGP